MDQKLEVEVKFADEDAAQVTTVLKEVGANDVKTRSRLAFADPATIVVCIMVAEALVNLVIKLLPLWKCGVVVDARGPKVTTEKDCALPAGSVLVISQDGTKTELQKPTEFDIKSLIDKVLPRT
jgi:hypothetical protein